MKLNNDSYMALKAFERAPGSVKREGQSHGISDTQRDSLTRQVRDELASAQTMCGPQQHRMQQGPSSETFENSPYIRYSKSTSENTETWTNPDKNSFVQVKDKTTITDSEGFSLSGARVYDSFGIQSHSDASYGRETQGYIAGMKITENNGSSFATAFKIDKRNPENSWIQEWNIR